MPALSRYRLPPRARKVPRPRQPDAIRMRYFAALKPFLADMRREVAERIRPMLKELVSRHEERTRVDAAMPPGKRASVLLEGVSRRIVAKWPNERLAGVAQEMAQATSKFQKAQLFNQVKGSLGITLPAMMDKGVAARMAHFTAENVALIRSVQTRYLDDVGKVVLRGISTGARAADIADELEDRFGVAETNALRIARDQIGKFNGQLNAVRQQQLGVEGFVWRTMRDGRVREEHEDLDGEKFSYDDPPLEGLPGEPINCRCYAEPDFAGLLEDE